MILLLFKLTLPVLYYATFLTSPEYIALFNDNGLNEALKQPYSVNVAYYKYIVTLFQYTRTLQ